jgi:preprotein translocase subunit YajC
MLFALITLFADDAAGGQQGAPPITSMLPLLLIGIGMVFFMMMTSRRQKNQQQQLLAGLKRNDKVITNAGIIGVVVDVRDKKDDDIKEEELVLRVDDNSNTRMRVLKSSIARVFSSQSAGGADKK